MKTFGKLIAALFTVFLAGASHAQTENINFNDFVKQTQQSSSDYGQMRVGWWIPIEFWEMSLRAAGLPENEVEDFCETLAPYCMFAVIDGSSEGTTFTYQPESKIRKSIRFVANGVSYKPLHESSLTDEAQLVLEVIRPIFKQMMGQMGENLNLYVFSNFNSGNVRLSNPAEPGLVRLELLDYSYEWNTPIPCMTRPKICPEDGEELNGTWNYCPIHGNALVQKEDPSE